MVPKSFFVENFEQFGKNVRVRKVPAKKDFLFKDTMTTNLFQKSFRKLSKSALNFVYITVRLHTRGLLTFLRDFWDTERTEREIRKKSIVEKHTS